jgi:CO/xanthine dehydrogenase FAD-binding subunit
MSLRGAGLDAIERRDDALAIGAAVTLTRLLEQDEVPMLREAARRTASWTIRNMGTVGGNLFTPPPGGDVAVALLALDARVRLVGPHGARTLALADLYTGFMTTALEADELVAEILVPTVELETAFLKLGRKQANTPAVVTVAVALRRREGIVETVRIALGAAGPHPIRAAGAEAALTGTALRLADIARAAEAAARECRPFTDAIATEWYRRRMTGVLVRRALDQVAGRRPGASGEER